MARKKGQNQIRLRLRSLLLKALAVIFTFYITCLYIIIRIFLLLPLPKVSYIFKDFIFTLSTFRKQFTLTSGMYIILNSTFSLVSVLLVVNYCEKMLYIVQWISHQTHRVFLNFVFPGIPQVTSFITSWVVLLYLILGYAGLSSQISLTLDLITIYNLPSICIYKMLAYLYSKLLKFIKFSFQVYRYDYRNWLSCQYKILEKTQQINKIMAVAGILIFSQILAVVGFYYLWLAAVMLVLLVFINFLRNLVEVVRKSGQILLKIKGQKYVLSQQTEIKWIPLMGVQHIQSVFLGRDLIQLTKLDDHLHSTGSFNLNEIYQCFSNPSMS